ncbi:MAG: HEPN domain-containing protein [Thermodesulfobacteriaceae bacterium]|nr:HEPN domain-containing protein [Thermodesulfobacteriaceae bacterium]MCX8041407.1 HEPN domain-containing protein [Thermodesulfobacteriaceae bacterium]MDW8135825.1 HEPN domain-containing protein [Thermodesulfobacterium sp.]
MKGNLQEIANKWLKQAEYDLEDARKAFQWGSFNLCCFLAQQAAEKAVKAILFACGCEEVWGHSVGSLLQIASNFYLQLKELLPLAKSLDKYYIPTRYPDVLPDDAIPSEVYDEEDAQRALHKAEKILEKLKELLRT